jgi:hypothetical protein
VALPILFYTSWVLFERSELPLVVFLDPILWALLWTASGLSRQARLTSFSLLAYGDKQPKRLAGVSSIGEEEK